MLQGVEVGGGGDLQLCGAWARCGARKLSQVDDEDLLNRLWAPCGDYRCIPEVST